MTNIRNGLTPDRLTAVLYSCPVSWIAVEGPKVPLMAGRFLTVEREGTEDELIRSLADPHTVRTSRTDRRGELMDSLCLAVSRDAGLIYSVWIESVPLPPYAHLHANRFRHTATDYRLVSQICEFAADSTAVWDALLPEYRAAPQDANNDD